MRSPRAWSTQKVPIEATPLTSAVEDWVAVRLARRAFHPIYAANMRHSLLELATRLHARGGRTWSDLTPRDVAQFATVGASGWTRTHHAQVSRRGWVRAFLHHLAQQGQEVSAALAAVPRQRTRRASSDRRPPSSPLMVEVRRYLRQRLPLTRPGADWAEHAAHTLWDLVEHLAALGHRRWDEAAVAELERCLPSIAAAAPPGRDRILRAFATHLRSAPGPSNGEPPEV